MGEGPITNDDNASSRHAALYPFDAIGEGFPIDDDGLLKSEYLILACLNEEAIVELQRKNIITSPISRLAFLWKPRAEEYLPIEVDIEKDFGLMEAVRIVHDQDDFRSVFHLRARDGGQTSSDQETVGGGGGQTSNDQETGGGQDQW